jgi:hypothetical protein
MRRTLLSLCGGLGTGGLFLGAGRAGLHLLQPDLDGASASLPDAEWMILELLVIFLSGVMGGYVTAAIARSEGLRHAMMLGAAVVLISTIAMVIDTSALPLVWYRLGAILSILPAVAMGGAMRAERTRRSRRIERAEPRAA